MSTDRQTLNILILELATMVVAIALTFGANLLTAYNLPDVLYFVFATGIVIWFWWGYVMDRLEFPPRTKRFPLMDVLVLIFIALIPFALRQREIWAIAGTLAAVLAAWAMMIEGIIRENADLLDEGVRRKLRLEVSQRVLVALLLVLDGVLGFVFPTFAFFLLYSAGVFAVGWTVVTRRMGRSASGRAVSA